jgi:hypothetical protein
MASRATSACIIGGRLHGGGKLTNVERQRRYRDRRNILADSADHLGRDRRRRDSIAPNTTLFATTAYQHNVDGQPSIRLDRARRRHHEVVSAAEDASAAPMELMFLLGLYVWQSRAVPQTNSRRGSLGPRQNPRRGFHMSGTSGRQSGNNEPDESAGGRKKKLRRCFRAGASNGH